MYDNSLKTPCRNVHKTRNISISSSQILIHNGIKRLKVNKHYNNTLMETIISAKLMQDLTCALLMLIRFISCNILCSHKQNVAILTILTTALFEPKVNILHGKAHHKTNNLPENNTSGVILVYLPLLHNPKYALSVL